MLDDKVILITGGTGSFGQKFTELLLSTCKPRKIIIFSRDELKQFDMGRTFPTARFPCMRYFLGDVRDRDRLYRAFDGVDVVVHAAALKQIPACEYNPLEAVKTNVLGAANIVDAAIDRNVSRVLALSTDKAVNPINLYGATKLCSDKLFTVANNYAGPHGTRFSVVRYGNVAGSRGSVIPLFLELRARGVLPITDPRMTRFWITLEQGTRFALDSLHRMRGGEVFVPKIPSMNVMELARAIAPECRTEVVGIRPGEKLHEVLITEDDARNTVEYERHFAILPSFRGWGSQEAPADDGGRPCAESFEYRSDKNTQWLAGDDLRRMLKDLGAADGR
jgi:UDP-N-acetylglucosamine 4,6-dehydratase